MIWAFSELKKHSLLRLVLRNLALLFLVYHGWLYFKEYLNLPFITALFLVSALGGTLFALYSWRLLPALGIFLGSLFLIRGILFLFVKDDLFCFYFDRTFFPALLPGIIGWVFNFLFIRYKKFLPLESLLKGFMLMGIFSAQSHYNLTLYHPTVFSLLIILFTLLELAILRESPVEKKEDVQFLFLVPGLLLLLFIFITRNYNHQASRTRGGLMESTLFQFDFSDYLSLQEEVEQGEDLVLLFRKEGEVDRLLLRRSILSAYDGKGGFYQDKEITFPGREETEGRSMVDQEYYLVSLDPSARVALNAPEEITTLKNWPGSSFTALYKARSRVSWINKGILSLEELPAMEMEEYLYYTNYGGDTFIREMAEEITTEAGTYGEKVIALEEYLKSHFYYSLKPGIPGEGENPLHYFLTESRKGYCTYFAFAMALMCRGLGIPARVAVGFSTNPSWEVMNFYEIRGYQAHAWVEIYFGSYGWIEFDPTTNRIAPGEEESITFLSIAGMSQESRNMINEILGREILPGEEDLLPGDPGEKKNDKSQWLIFILGTILLTAYLAAGPGKKLLSLGIYMLINDRRKKVKALYRYAIELIPVRKNNEESPLDFAARVSREPGLHLEKLSQVFLKSSFSPVFSREDLEEARAGFILFRESLVKKIPPGKRIIHFFNPFPGRRL